VPGAFGSLQALLTLKILLAIPGQLAGELLLLDFMSFSSTKLKAPRRAACTAPACALIQNLGTAPGHADIEVELPSLAAAQERQFEIIDIRTADEAAATPLAATPLAAARLTAVATAPPRHIAMAHLLANPAALAAAGRYLLVCASGKRSLATARELRRQGLAVYSLAGGLQRLNH
jgi:adenylyltransferase/sulfurtransferase